MFSPPSAATIIISRSQLTRGGGACIPGFFRTLLQKFTVLSDQEVPGFHKNIYRDLRPSFTRSKIFDNMCCLFRQQRQHSKISLWTGASRKALWKTVGKVIFSLFNLKNRFRCLIALHVGAECVLVCM